MLRWFCFRLDEDYILNTICISGARLGLKLQRSAHRIAWTIWRRVPSRIFIVYYGYISHDNGRTSTTHRLKFLVFKPLESRLIGVRCAGGRGELHRNERRSFSYDVPACSELRISCCTTTCTQIHQRGRENERTMTARGWNVTKNKTSRNILGRWYGKYKKWKSHIGIVRVLYYILLSVVRSFRT